jgi:hypothetical protein
MIDIMIARLTHVEWMYQLEMAMQKGTSNVNLRTYNECELGVWLYGEGLRTYEEIPEIEMLERTHKAFHLAADNVIKWLKGPKLSPHQMAQAQVDFDEALRMSKEVVYHLTILELKMLRRYQEYERATKSGVGEILFAPFKRLVGGNKPKGLNIAKLSLDLLKGDLEGKGR